MNEVLKKVAGLFNDNGITWALGASMLMSHHGLCDRANDIDMMIDLKDIDRVSSLMDSMSTRKEYRESDVYRTKHFLEYEVDGVEIDILAGLVIKHEEGCFEYLFDDSSVDVTDALDGVEIKYSSIEDWYMLYQLMPGKESKADLIEDYLRKNGWMKYRYILRQDPNSLPKNIRLRLESLRDELINPGRLREKILSMGASMTGFADLTEVERGNRRGYDYGVSIAVALDPEIMRNISGGPTPEYYEEYKRVNSRLNEIDDEIARLIIDAGHEAFSNKQSNVVIDKSTQTTMLPHKTVATRAGMGFIGKCGLLVTPDFGSAVRISSVLTNMKLDTGAPINNSECGECRECQLHCPASAVKGNPWDVGRERDFYYDALKCMEYGLSASEKAGIFGEELCGLCIIYCPRSRKYLYGRNEND